MEGARLSPRPRSCGHSYDPIVDVRTAMAACFDSGRLDSRFIAMEHLGGSVVPEEVVVSGVEANASYFHRALADNLDPEFLDIDIDVAGSRIIELNDTDSVPGREAGMDTVRLRIAEDAVGLKATAA